MVLKHLVKHQHAASLHCLTISINGILLTHHWFYHFFFDIISMFKYKANNEILRLWISLSRWKH